MKELLIDNYAKSSIDGFGHIKAHAGNIVYITFGNQWVIGGFSQYQRHL